MDLGCVLPKTKVPYSSSSVWVVLRAEVSSFTHVGGGSWTGKRYYPMKRSTYLHEQMLVHRASKVSPKEFYDNTACGKTVYLTKVTFWGCVEACVRCAHIVGLRANSRTGHHVVTAGQCWNMCWNTCWNTCWNRSSSLSLKELQLNVSDLDHSYIV